MSTRDLRTADKSGQATRSGRVPLSPSEHAWVVALALIGASSASLATTAPGDSNLALVVELLGQTLGTIALAWWHTRRCRLLDQPPIITPLIAVVALLWGAAEPAWRAVGWGRSGEVVLLDSFKLATLGAAAVGRWPSGARGALGMALFLQLFAAALSTAPGIGMLTATFAAGGVAWTSRRYWCDLRPRMLNHSEHSRAPARWLLVPILLLAVGLLVAARQESLLTRAWGGFVPTSGSTSGSAYDPFARDGIGAGDAVVAGRDRIESFAPIDDAPFVASDQPSLYDVFDERYGEPAPPQRLERAITLSNDRLIEQRCQTLTAANEVGREFTIERRGPSLAQRVDRPARPALFHVVGRTPLHLRTEVFDLFDGLRWHSDRTPPKRPQPLQVVTSAAVPWIEPPRRAESVNIFRGAEVHALKIMRLDTPRIPAPPHLTGIAVAKLDDPSMLRWAQPSIVQFDRHRIPPLTIIRLASETVDWPFVADSYLRPAWIHEAYTQVPAIVDSTKLESLARAWTHGIPRGWRQIETIIDRLRSDYLLAADAPTSSESTTSCEVFLTETRRGPDYQFATAAALLLRSLGYSTRLVAGFYVSPERYDPRLGHTPVVSDDAHVWLEVYMGADIWLTLEPTPGYQRLGPPPTWWEQSLSLAANVCNSLVAHWPSWTMLVVVCGLLVLRRHALYDALRSLAWRCDPCRCGRRTMRQAARLVDDRCRWAGSPRPRGMTLSRWLQTLHDQRGLLDPIAIQQLSAWLDWAAYAPSHRAPPPGDPRRQAADLLRLCTRHRLTTSTRSTSQRSEPARRMSPGDQLEAGSRRPWVDPSGSRTAQLSIEPRVPTC